VITEAVITERSVGADQRHRCRPRRGIVQGSPRASPEMLVLVTRLRRCFTPRGLRRTRVSSGVAAGVVGGEVDEHALNEEVTDLEHVTPAAGAPVLHARAPRPERVGGGRSGSSPEPCATPRHAICKVMPRWRSRRRTRRRHSHGQRQLTLARAGVVRAGPGWAGIQPLSRCQKPRFEEAVLGAVDPLHLEVHRSSEGLVDCLLLRGRDDASKFDEAMLDDLLDRWQRKPSSLVPRPTRRGGWRAGRRR
jgi:hypothetical protein